MAAQYIHPVQYIYCTRRRYGGSFESSQMSLCTLKMDVALPRPASTTTGAIDNMVRDDAWMPLCTLRMEVAIPTMHSREGAGPISDSVRVQKHGKGMKTKEQTRAF